MTKFDDLRQQAARQKRAAEAEFDRLRSIGFAPDQLRAIMARAYLGAQKPLDEARAAAQGDVADRALAKTRLIHGAEDLRGSADPTAFQASYRQAQAVADAAASPNEAMVLLRRAERSGDELLARAVASRAHSRGWKPVTDAYAQSRPSWKAAAAEHADARIAVGIGSAVLFGLKRPPELQGLDRRAIESLVEANKPLYDRVDAGPPPDLSPLAAFGAGRGPA